MENTDIYIKVLFESCGSFLYTALVKGTSYQNEGWWVLARVICFVLVNELVPVVNVDNFGRSNEMNQINQTIQT